MNLLICELGTATGTTTTGDVIIVPTTQTAPDATNENNMLPTAFTAPKQADIVGTKACFHSGAKGTGMIAGTDQDLFTMTIISGAQTTWLNTYELASKESTNADGQALPHNYAANA